MIVRKFKLHVSESTICLPNHVHFAIYFKFPTFLLASYFVGFFSLLVQSVENSAVPWYIVCRFAHMPFFSNTKQ